MHLFFYNIFLRLYKIAIRLAALWNPKARLWVAGRKHLLDKPGNILRPTAGNALPRTTDTGPLVWMHCASLGEFEQGRPLLEQIRIQYPHTRILVTFFSPSGYEVRKDYPGADYISYLPMDSGKTARKFLDMVQPSLVLWMKYEYWYYYLLALKKRNIPKLLVSGIFRPDQPFFKWYGRLHLYILECFYHLFVQTQASRDLLAKIGFAGQATVSGDTRFDRVITIAGQVEPLPLIEAFCGNSTVIVAGSTWPEDEEELDHYANTNPGIKFILAPHEVDEEHLQDIEKLFKHTIRYSQMQDTGYRIPDTGNVLIIDNIGMLSKLYRYATITYVGGGFGGDGVHNVLEAAVYGKPVVFGPVYEKYTEAVDLVQAGGGFTVENAIELESTFNDLLRNRSGYEAACRAAREYVYAQKGATGKVMQFIQVNRLLIN